MARITFLTRKFHCLGCGHDFSAGFWNSRPINKRFGLYGPEVKDTDYRPMYWDLRCPNCGVGPEQFADATPRPNSCNVFIGIRRQSDRPVVYRWFDEHGREKYRFPSAADPALIAADAKDEREYEARMHDWRLNSALQRPHEERVEFASLRALESFLKSQTPNHRDWQVPLNDLLDYDNPDTAISDHDPGVADEADEILSVDDAGVATEAEIAAFESRTDGRALIESH